MNEERKTGRLLLILLCGALMIGCDEDDNTAQYSQGIHILSPANDTVFVRQVAGVVEGEWYVDSLIACTATVFANIPDSIFQAEVIGGPGGEFQVFDRVFRANVFTSHIVPAAEFPPGDPPEEPLEFTYRVRCFAESGTYESEERRFWIQLR